MNMWHELRSRIELNRRASYGDPPIFQLILDLMKDIEKKACMRDMMVQYILEPPEGSIEWAVREAIHGNTIQHRFGDLQRTLKKGDYPDMMLMEHKWKMYPTVHTTMIPKSGWYAEKKINTPIWSEL